MVCVGEVFNIETLRLDFVFDWGMFLPFIKALNGVLIPFVDSLNI